jgi:hypothetical protein
LEIEQARTEGEEEEGWEGLKRRKDVYKYIKEGASPRVRESRHPYPYPYPYPHIL